MVFVLSVLYRVYNLPEFVLNRVYNFAQVFPKHCTCFCPKQAMYFKFFFCPISRVRVSNPQRLTSRQILVDNPLPSRGGSVKCQLVKTEIII